MRVSYRGVLGSHKIVFYPLPKFDPRTWLQGSDYLLFDIDCDRFATGFRLSSRSIANPSMMIHFKVALTTAIHLETLVHFSRIRAMCIAEVTSKHLLDLTAAHW